MLIEKILEIGISLKNKNLEAILELTFEDLTPNPPLHKMERGTQRER